MNCTQVDEVTAKTNNFAEIPADGQLDTSKPSTQEVKPAAALPTATELQASPGEKIESAQIKEPVPSEEKEPSTVSTEKYNKLKRKFSELRQVSKPDLPAAGERSPLTTHDL